MTRPFWIIGHRGAPLEAPENTLGSLRRAVALGANAVEVDLVSTADGHVVLWHDARPNTPVAIARQLGLEPGGFRPSTPPPGSPLRRPVCELTLEELLTSHGYSGRKLEAEVPLTTLEQMAAWAAQEPALEAIFFDLKADALVRDATRLGQVVDAIDRALAGRGPRLFGLHTEESVVRRLLARRPVAGRADAGLQAVWDHPGPGGLEDALRLGLRTVCLGLSLIHRFGAVHAEAAAAVAARERGEVDTVVVWSFDEVDEQEAFLALGVDGVMTKRPGQLRRLYEGLVP